MNREEDRKGSFLRSDNKSWAGSSLFYMCLNDLPINDTVFQLPRNAVISNGDLIVYVDSLLYQLDKCRSAVYDSTDKHPIRSYEYVVKIATILKSWASEGHGLLIV